MRAKALNFDVCGLFRAAHSHNPVRYSHIVVGTLASVNLGTKKTGVSPPADFSFFSPLLLTMACFLFFRYAAATHVTAHALTTTHRHFVCSVLLFHNFNLLFFVSYNSYVFCMNYVEIKIHHEKGFVNNFFSKNWNFLKTVLLIRPEKSL